MSRSKRIPNSSGLEVEFEVRSQLRAGLLRRFTDLVDMLGAVLCHISFSVSKFSSRDLRYIYIWNDGDICLCG